MANRSLVLNSNLVIQSWRFLYHLAQGQGFQPHSWLWCLCSSPCLSSSCAQLGSQWFSDPYPGDSKCCAPGCPNLSKILGSDLFREAMFFFLLMLLHLFIHIIFWIYWFLTTVRIEHLYISRVTTRGVSGHDRYKDNTTFFWLDASCPEGSPYGKWLVFAV